MDSTHEIEKLKHEIAEIGSQLEKLGHTKESLYQEKKVFEQQQSDSINSAKQLKAQKSAVDNKIKEKKLLRTTLNKELRQLSVKFSQARRQRKSFKGENPDHIKRQIEAMQFSIETEGLSFEREQNYMARIKQLKARLAELGAQNGGAEDFDSLSKQAAEKKVLADGTHSEIQKLAEQSASIFAELTKKAKEIDEIKKKRIELSDKLKSIRSEIEQSNANLSDTLNKWLEITKDMPPEAKPVMAESMTNREEEQSIISKFKNAKRLTKEDILKLQRFAAKKR